MDIQVSQKSSLSVKVDEKVYQIRKPKVKDQALLEAELKLVDEKKKTSSQAMELWLSNLGFPVDDIREWDIDTMAEICEKLGKIGQKKS